MATKKTTTKRSKASPTNKETSEAEESPVKTTKAASTKAASTKAEPAKAASTKTEPAKAESVCQVDSPSKGCCGCKASSKEEQCINAVNQKVLLASAAGLIPYPGLDIAAVTGIQVRLVSNLSKIYGVDFNKDLASSLIFGVLSSSGAITIGKGLAGSVLKAIPVVGTAMGMVVVPAAAGAATYAVGQLFIQHFEAGGTLLTFDSEKAKKHYDRLFEQGKKVAADLKENMPSFSKRKAETEETEAA